MKKAKKTRIWLTAAALLAVCLCALLVFGHFASARRDKTELDKIEITPTKQQNGFVDAATEFEVKAGGDVLPSENAFLQMLTVSPNVEFELIEQDGGYLIKTAENFEEDSLIRIDVCGQNGESKSWAFQTASVFAAENVFPGDESWNVPCSSEIRVAFSSADVAEEDFAAAFSVFPEVEGRVEKRGAVLCFVPNEPLLPFTEYCVTVSGELKNSAGEQLEESISFSFVTAEEQNGRGKLVNAADVSETFLTSEKPIIKYKAFGSADTAQAQVEVWRYNGAEEYKAALEEYLSATQHSLTDTVQPVISTEGLEPVMSFSDSDAFGEFEGDGYAVFPKKIAKGWYLAKLTAPDGNGGECSLFKFIQVSSITVFSTETAKNTVFWVNDGESESAAAGAEITLRREGEAVTAKTDGNGAAALENCGGNAKKGLLEIKYNGESFVSLYNFGGEPSAAEKYYTCLCLDRDSCGTEDRLSFWGVAIPKNGGDIPETVTVKITSAEGELCSKKVAPDELGSFFGEISFEGRDGSAAVLLEIEGETVCTENIFLRQNDAEVLSAKITLDKEICFAEDVITAQISITDGQGRPAEGVEVAVAFDGGEATTVTTDANGRAKAELTAVWKKNFWEPKNCEITAKSADGRVNIRSFCTVVGRDVAVYGNYNEKSGRVNVYAAEVVLPSEAADSVYADDFAALKGEAADKTVYGYLYRVWSTASVDNDASYYDFLQGKRVKVYKYRQYEQVVKRYKFQTGEAGDYIDGLPELKENSNYYMLLTTKDSEGRTSSCKVYIKTDSGYQNYYGRKNYSYVSNGAGRLKLYKNGDPVDEGRVFTVTAEGDYFVGGTSVAPGEDTVVCGAYFDGSKLYDVTPPAQDESTGKELSVKVEQKSGKLEITAEYADKSPAANAAGVVFITETGTDAGDVLNELYSTSDISRQSYNSCTQYTLVPDSNMSDEEAVSQKAAQKTAGAYRITTDSSGKASVEAEILAGDWNAIVILAAKNGESVFAGSAQKKLSVSEAFVLECIMPQTAEPKDEFAVLLHCGGEAVSDRAHVVEYTCNVKSAYRYSLEHPGTDITFKTNGGEDEFVSFNFGKLTEGEYIVTVNANCGSYSDSVSAKLTVTDGKPTQTVVEKLTADELTGFKAEAYPVTLCVVTNGSSLKGEMIGNLLACDESGFGEYAKRRVLNKYSESTDAKPLVTSNDDVLLMAKLALLREVTDAEYFYGAMEKAKTRTEAAAAYLGLAACGEAVLEDVRYLLADKEAELEEKLLLTAALAVLGDDDGARTSLEKLLGRNLVSKNDANGNEMLFIYRSGITDEEILRLTSAANLTALMLYDEYAEGFARYFLYEADADQAVTDKLLCLALLKDAEGRAKVEYAFESEAMAEELDGGDVLLLTLEYEQFKNLKLKCDADKVSVFAVHTKKQ